MLIPEAYCGVWTGRVEDDGRREGYSCRLEIHATGGTSVYTQARGLGKGSLQRTEAPLVFDEEYVGPAGGRRRWMLRLALTGAGELDCHWTTRGSKQQARATLRRVMDE